MTLLLNGKKVTTYICPDEVHKGKKGWNGYYASWVAKGALIKRLRNSKL
jgi:hypothetical protein